MVGQTVRGPIAHHEGPKKQATASCVFIRVYASVCICECVKPKADPVNLGGGGGGGGTKREKGHLCTNRHIYARHVVQKSITIGRAGTGVHRIRKDYLCGGGR